MTYLTILKVEVEKCRLVDKNCLCAARRQRDSMMGRGLRVCFATGDEERGALFLKGKGRDLINQLEAEVKLRMIRAPMWDDKFNPLPN